MAITGRFFLQPIRASLSTITSLSRSRLPFCEKFEPLKRCVKGIESSVGNQVRNSHWNLCSIRRFYANNCCKSGFDMLGIDHHSELPNYSETEEDPHIFLALAFARKLVMPIFLFITVLMNWDHPIVLAAKMILILVGTKPRPFSVYLFIEQFRRQIIRQQPFLYKFKSLYAKKVEVEDYAFLCLARVELKDQKLTLIGILGSWWVLPQSSCRRAFSDLRNKFPMKMNHPSPPLVAPPPPSLSICPCSNRGVDQLLKEYNGNLVVHNCLISADVDQGNLDKASKLFNEMRERNEILWTALISGFMKCGRVKEYMWASADLRNFGLRMSIWGLIVKVGFEHNCIGDIEIYKHVFNRMPEKSEISWTAMVQGLEKMVLERNLLFFLTKWRGLLLLRSTKLILSAVLFACSHCGLVDKGLRYFNSTEKSYGIRPNNRHYTCLVDMLSQPGCLPEAEKLIASMPCQPDSNTWAALLSGFSMHTSEKVAERTAKKLWEMAEEKSETLFHEEPGSCCIWRFDSVLKIARGEGCSSWTQTIAGQLHPQSHSLMEGNITSLSSMVCKQATKGLPSGYVSVYRTIGVGFVSPRVSLV
ncbi:pentatricopeptide repeat (PPR) superfamily protein [Actinidia rufa]|uniref:Pentatricopeptide repeat (PPR) superfamily protein n=1 Tax=Actinidia rufa TaxID=165716 RepID=A0A7J0EM11_9ERIC|nr:pentatricopeptide repeat (PPR) superfamily protein [Actinidia rufa]